MTSRILRWPDNVWRISANDSMARAAFFFFSNRFKERRVGMSLSLIFQSICNQQSSEDDIRGDLQDVGIRDVCWELISCNVDSWIYDPRYFGQRCEVRFCNSCSKFGVSENDVGLCCSHIWAGLAKKKWLNHVLVVASSNQSIGYRYILFNKWTFLFKFSSVKAPFARSLSGKWQ